MTAANCDERQRFVRNRVLLIAVCLAALAGAAVYAPMAHSGPVFCPLRLSVGLPCPGCGLTRGFCAATHGHWLEATRENLLALPLAMLFLAAPLVAAVELRRRRRLTFYRFMYARWLGRCTAVFLLAYQVGRLITWSADGTLARDYLPSSLAYQVVSYLAG